MDSDPNNDQQPEWQDPLSLEVVEEGRVRTEINNAQIQQQRRVAVKNIKRKAILILLALLALSIVAASIIVIRKMPADDPPVNNVTINTQSLDNGTLNEVTKAAGGETTQQLTISTDTIFKNSVVVQGTAEVAKSLLVQESLDVRGASTLRGNVTTAGALSVGTNLTVNGLITAAALNVGSITISSISISGNLAFDGHLIPGGASPSARASNAAGGGSVSISGNDTAGTITLKTGSNPSSGELTIITFRSGFSTTPKVQLTPVNEGASVLRYFATKSAGFFTLNTGSTPAANTTYTFDYLVTQ